MLVATWRAWVCDDAYITFRVVDNLVHGYGLRWNVDERVQVFTHPLWMLLHVPLYALFGHIYVVTIVLSLALTAGALWITMRSLPSAPPAAPVLLPLTLLSSRAFMDYTTSGLEAPLSFLLFALFAHYVARPTVHWTALITISSLAVLNRFDCVVLYAPVLGYLFVMSSDRPKARAYLGLTPLVAWFAFSVFYYGFAFPNTKPAKLSTGLGATQYIEQGWLYLNDVIVNDPASFVIMAMGILVAVVAASRARPEAAAVGDRRLGFVALGVVAYVGYVVYVGGDFMRGRHFALPVFASAWLICTTIGGFPRRVHAMCGAAFALAVALSALPTRMVATYVADQRALYAPEFSLFSRSSEGTLFLRTDLSDHPYVSDHGRFLALRPCREALVTQGAIGIYGYFAGPEVIVIDHYALSDALLAQLPWRPAPQRTFALDGLPIGHFQRALPDGYVESRLTGEGDRIDPALRSYYRRLRLITTGPLLSWPRLHAIADLNLGAMDDDLDAYIETKYASAEINPGGRTTWCASEFR